MDCNCLNEVDKDLDERQGGRVHSIFQISAAGITCRPALPIIRRDTGKNETRRGKAASFALTFCPFCGLRYGVENADQEAAQS